mgnify:FL=1|tara:strand:- start:183 stop:545 length:363 start_codon:yes stop_codon:yes gene_type:complete
MGKAKQNKQVGGIINPIQPMYNPTQADQARQQSMMEGQQQQQNTRMQPQGQPSAKDMDTPVTQGMAKGGKLKDVPEGNKGLSKLPPNVRNTMGFKNRGGTISKGNSDYRSTGMFYKGGKV